MFLLLQVGRENMFLESKIPSCCVMDTLGSITSLYQVIQEYLILSGTRFARNSISCRITWYSWKNRQAMAHCVSFALPGWFIRPLWLHQFDAFDTPQSCFHLMFLRYWCYVNWYYLCQHGTIAYSQLYGCYVLSLNVSQSWTHFWEVTLLHLSISIFFHVNLYCLCVLWNVSLGSLVFVPALYIWTVSIYQLQLLMEERATDWGQLMKADNVQKPILRVKSDELPQVRELTPILKHGNVVKQSKVCPLSPWSQTIHFPFLEEWIHLSRERWKFISKNEHLWGPTEMDVLRCGVGGKAGSSCQSQFAQRSSVPC